MEPSEQQDTSEAAPSELEEAGLPPGNHSLEVAARDGIGPLSPLGRETWHGQSRPCVTCGQLVRRDATECGHCGQELSEEMLERMRAHAGPWYVLEHVRPFPGVSLERIIRQIRRGLITPTSIVRGPATDFQWRFALETPGLCRYFSRCWSCHEQISPTDVYCRYCLSHLTLEQSRPAPAVPPSPKSVAQSAPVSGAAPEVTSPTAAASATPERANNKTDAADSDAPSGGSLEQLSAAVSRVDVQGADELWDAPPRVGGVRATWIVAALLIVVVIAMLFLTRVRRQSETTPSSPTPRATRSVQQEHTPAPADFP